MYLFFMIFMLVAYITILTGLIFVPMNFTIM